MEEAELRRRFFQNYGQGYWGSWHLLKPMDTAVLADTPLQHWVDSASGIAETSQVVAPTV